MGIYSGWEEESYREEYVAAERLALADDLQAASDEPYTNGNQCGHCPTCCTEEQGHGN